MYLIGDIGNTDIKICLFDKNYKVVKKLILKTNLISNKYLALKLNFLKKYSLKINIILFSSVVPLVYSVIKKFLKKKLKLKCIELKQVNLNKLVKITVNKKQVGSDRISNAIGIIDKKSNYIILDFGTATTFDVIIKDKYLGGVIAPGVNLSLKTLTSKASLIPPVKISKISKIIGTNTSTAVKAGFYWGYAGLIDNVIKLIIKQTNKRFKIILTGGLANLFKNTIKGKIEVKKDLTLNGLLKVAINLK